MCRRPSLAFAEIAWRWSFGAAAVAVLAFSVLEFFDTLAVSGRDLFLLRTRHPLLVLKAVLHILKGSAFRAKWVAMLVLIVLSLAWVIVASIGGRATVKRLRSYLRDRGNGMPPSAEGHGAPQQFPLGLNFLRVLLTAATGSAIFGAFILSAAASSAADPSPGGAMLIFTAVALGLGMVWCVLNWLLSISALLAVAERKRTFAAIRSAVDLCCNHTGPVLAAGTWFGLAHLVLFFLVTSVLMFPLAFAGVLPPGIVLGGVILISLLYFAAADFLYVGRMAAYMVIIQCPAEAQGEVPQGSSSFGTALRRLQTGVDPGELILCDT